MINLTSKQNITDSLKSLSNIMFNVNYFQQI
jgi:hypothetical protein